MKKKCKTFSPEGGDSKTQKQRYNIVHNSHNSLGKNPKKIFAVYYRNNFDVVIRFTQNSFPIYY